MKDLAQLEKEKNIRPSPEIDAFMKVVFWCLKFITSNTRRKKLDFYNREFLILFH